jgi:hypothetical protein
MGLGIFWELAAPPRFGPTDAVGLIVKLRESALSVGFGEVSEVVEAFSHPPAQAALPGTSGSDSDALADRAWALTQGMIAVPAPTDSEPTRLCRIAPQHVIAFRGYSAGAEDAVFGLACYTPIQDTRVPAGYCWSGGCATQGAHLRGGPAGFLAAHRAIVGVLDRARSAGLAVTVRDDGGYWESRDPKVLFDKLQGWEQLVAAIARKRLSGKAVPLASDVRSQIEARRRERPRLDREPAEELEG